MSPPAGPQFKIDSLCKKHYTGFISIQNFIFFIQNLRIVRRPALMECPAQGRNLHGRNQAPHRQLHRHVRHAQGCRYADHRFCAYRRALSHAGGQRPVPDRVFPVHLPRSADVRLFIASGYGFRKRSIHKCIHQQLKSLLKPYAYTALFTCVLHFIIHYKTFQYLPGTIGESIKVTGGFLLGLPHTAEYFGQEFFSCGPMWYLLALMVGWVLLDVILNIFPERYVPWAVAGCVLLGWGASLVWELPFCLIQGAVVVPYLYIGFLAKKKHLLDEPLPPKVFAGLLAATALIAVGALATRTTDCISLAEWSLGPLSIFLDGAAGLLFIRLFMRLSHGHGPIVHFLEAVGRRSLNIFCVHTVEIIAIPWYLMVAKFSAQPVLGMWLQYAIALGSIWLVCELLRVRRALIIRFFPAQRRTPAVHYTSRH